MVYGPSHAPRRLVDASVHAGTAGVAKPGPSLQALGLERAFTTAADFGGMASQRLQIGAVFHKALPQVAQLEKAESTFRSYLTEFGLTPSARAKLKTEEPENKDDPLSKYGV